jgi:NAD(P)-dependent dehydrogenase (short-subunit alcohol dehydrogenase family)
VLLEGKRVLVLGGWGLVGAAVCRELLPERPSALLLHSLRTADAEAAVRELRERFPGSPTILTPLHGDIFLPLELQARSRADLFADPATRKRLLDGIYEELSENVLQGATLFGLISEHRPHVIIDCINTATALAYQNLYDSVRAVRRLLKSSRGGNASPPEAMRRLAQAVEEQLGVLQVPQLIRHIQVLFEAMLRSGTDLYLKIGTTGTGGMGLNVPYTHSEERPSRLLLSKSALAGAHSLLLFLMGSTPGGPVVKEIKPAAAVAWKAIGKGPVLRGGRPITLFDCPLEAALEPGAALRGEPAPWRPAAGGGVLESAFVDMGENGMFSLEEFEAVTTPGQMEFVTPEEIARHALAEIRGRRTGRDVVGAIAGACLGPSYRAGVLRRSAIEELSALDSEESPSVAFEMLGPPRLSKLLYEAHLLHQCCRPFPALLAAEPENVSSDLVALIARRPELRARILSIGIPILLPDGRLLRGPEVKIPADADTAGWAPGAEELERWARAGWVDLRLANVELWQGRLHAIRSELAQRGTAGAGAAAGSVEHLTTVYWEGVRPYSPGKLAAWILANEDGGERYL